jgi:predicted RNA-binding Zn-ribbon protein involved in translation (DUF1610 family)
MDRICRDIEGIERKEFDYSKGFGTFRIKTLLHNQTTIEVSKDVITKYLALEKVALDKIDEYAREFDNEDEEDMKKTNFKEMYYAEARKEFCDYCKSINVGYVDCVDMIIKYTYKTNDLKMAFLWAVFGAVIINNINSNLKKSLDEGYMMCQECGKRVIKESNRQTKCADCSKKAIRENDRNRKKEIPHLEKVS